MLTSNTYCVVTVIVVFALNRSCSAQAEGSVGAVINSVRVNTIGQPGQYVKMGVLALLYTIQVHLI